MTTRAGVPAGYVALEDGGTRGALLAALEQPLRAALAGGTFYAYAEGHAQKRALEGRAIAYAVALPSCAARVVVRHSRHGGMLAPFTGDRFLGETRAPRELAIAIALTERGVPTPEVVAYATYAAGAFRRRADVVTREVPRSRDLAAALAESDAGARAEGVEAAGRLLATLAAASVYHPDLNLKNILLSRTDQGGTKAYLLDVDRVRFHPPAEGARVSEWNIARLVRSGDKWRTLHGLAFGADTVRALRAAMEAP